MVIYTYGTPKLFFSHFLLGVLEFIEGLVALLTLGCVRLGLSYTFMCSVAIEEMEFRKKHNIDCDNPWPRILIWPRRVK